VRLALVTALVAAMLQTSMDAFADRQPPTKPDARTLRTLTETNNFTLGRPSHIRVLPDGSSILFLRSSGPKDRSASLWELDTKTMKERMLISPEQILQGREETLSKEEKAARERKRISTGGFTSFDLALNGARILLKLSGKVFLVERSSGRPYQVPIPEGVVLDPRLSPTGDRIAFVRDYNLFVLDLPEPLFDASGRPEKPKNPMTALTTNGSESLSHGLAEFVAQEEMNRFVGYWWSPDGTKIAYQTNDTSRVERFTIADASKPERPAHTFAYPRAGRTNADVTLTIASIDGKTKAPVQWDRAKFPYLTRVLWQRNSPLSILIESRDQKDEQFLRVDSLSGRTSLLHEEHDDAWLNLSTSAPRWMPDGLSYLWATERSGGWAIERHWPVPPGGGGAQRIEEVLDAGAGFAQIVHVDEARSLVWFLGGPDPTELQLYRAPLAGKVQGAPVMVSAGGGEHDAIFSQDGSTYALVRVTLDEMPRAAIHRVEKGEGSAPPIAIASLALEPDFRPTVEVVPPAKAGGFNAVILRPHTFKPHQRYPVILHVYGGPGYAMVHRSMLNYFLPQWIADHGFIVVSIDGRGTPRRGRTFERALRGQFGAVPLDDQVVALKALGAQYQELDLTRVGVYGWSFGGYLAALSVLRRPDVFKVGVAGAPVVDWEYYDTHYTERYLGLPDRDRPAYDASSLLTYASKLERPLLLVHGIADDNVYFAHTLQLADALFRAQRPFELLPLVGLTHQVADPGVREALHQRIVHFLGSALW
jgi:dipeptidyl-peptidase 4